MSKAWSSRSIGLGLALLVTVALAVMVGDPPSQDAAPARDRARGAPTTGATAAPAVTRAPADAVPGSLRVPERAPFGKPVDLFEGGALQPPPPARATDVVTPRPPPAPQAPPLPFRYIGQETSAGRTVVLLMQGDAPIVAAPGETIGSQYRLDSFDAAAVRFTFLPLNMRQELRTGGAP